ncbi:glycosyl hydrolase family 71-domain-containing protein [Trametes gibbosa]|nr:glycosyl hydrolase family 71-domain-containing protein [Trametes gibbosa]
MARFSGRFAALQVAAFAAVAAAYPLALKRQDTSSQKLVVAHHIVGLTGGGGPGDFTLDTWKNDVTLASSKGIDGFALNIGADPFTFDQVGFAYQAAAAVNPNFKMFLSLDMGAINVQMGCNSTDTAAFLRNVTSTFITQPSQLQVGGKALVSTFAGESCFLGEADVFTGWEKQFTQHPDLVGKIHFVPSFFIDVQQFPNFKNVLDGDFNFNGGWPLELTTAAAPQLIGGNLDFNNLTPDQQTALSSKIGAFDVDDQHITQLGLVADSAHTYMTAVAPWFFTHFDSKNFIFDSDDHLYVTRWQNVIQNRDKVDLVELVTWNDFGESHYLGPIEGNLPAGSEAWANGFDHQGFLEITNHFATWYKTGTEPAITTDQLVMWARPHPKDAKPADPLGPPLNVELTQDQLWAVVLATAPGTLTLATGDNASQSFDVQPGVNKFNMTLTPNGFMSGTLTRDNATVIQLKPDGYTFNPTPAAFNLNIFVAAAAAGADGGAAPPPADPAPPANSTAAPAPAPTDTTAPTSTADPAAPAPTDTAVPPAPTNTAPGAPPAAPTDPATPAPSNPASPPASTSLGTPAPTDSAAVPPASTDLTDPGAAPTNPTEPAAPTDPAAVPPA